MKTKIDKNKSVKNKIVKNKTVKNKKKKDVKKTNTKKYIKSLKHKTSILHNEPLDLIITETKPTSIHNYYKKVLLHYLKTPFNKDNIHLPQNDYYTYINEKWIKDLTINNGYTE